jgi:hypothetical protein
MGGARTLGDVVEVSDYDADAFVEHLDGIALRRQIGDHCHSEKNVHVQNEPPPKKGTKEPREFSHGWGLNWKSRPLGPPCRSACSYGQPLSSRPRPSPP